jgi:pimeloyl-ACP methyl ester carboxylesterase
MKKTLILLAVAVSGIVICLAIDPGRFAFDYIDVGGHKLRMLISGHGNSTVVFEAGGTGAAGGPLESWERVQPAVSGFARTVTYDRAGIGMSAPGPKPRDARQIALELHTALHNAHVEPPYVLVGHSFGGPFNRVFADMYPSEIAGMVLIDPTPEEFVTWNRAREGHPEKRDDEEGKEIQASLDEAHQSHIPPGVPVFLISAMGPRVLPDSISAEDREEMKIILPVKLKFYREWLDKIPNSRLIVTENSGHGVPFEEPELVIQVIRDAVERVNHNNQGKL